MVPATALKAKASVPFIHQRVVKKLLQFRNKSAPISINQRSGSHTYLLDGIAVGDKESAHPERG